MIHKISVAPDTERKALLKEMRKRLMTGGAVIRLESERKWPQIDQQQLLETYASSATVGSVDELVLEQLAQLPTLAASVREALSRLSLPLVNTQLLLRSDLTDSERSSLLKQLSPRKRGPVLEQHIIQNLLKMDTQETRLFLQENLGAGNDKVLARIALCDSGKTKELPTDVLYLLQRDPSQDVRFAARALIER